MDIELVKCECCGLKEDCTQEYISEVKAKFEGKWLCGLCSEAVSDEVDRGKKQSGMDEAVKAHMSFCRKYKSKNPAVRVADGMKQMLRRRSGDMSSSPSSSAKKYSRSSSTCQGEGLTAVEASAGFLLFACVLSCKNFKVLSSGKHINPKTPNLFDVCVEQRMEPLKDNEEHVF